MKGVYVTATNQAVLGLVIEWNTYVSKQISLLRQSVLLEQFN